MDEQPADSSQTANCDHIPIIDLSSIDSPHIEDRRQLAQNIYGACTQVGFFYVKNHGISEESISGIHQAAERFFNLPEDQKMKVYIGNSKKFRGYSPIGGERSTGTDDEPISVEEATGVLSEAFDVGYELAMDFQKSKDDVLPPDIYRLYGDNQWPDQETLAGFSQTYIQYCGTLLEFCRRLMKIFALSLDVPEEYFDSKIRNPGVTSRMMHYPAQPATETREGLGAHTDFECFTILSQGSVPGLQVLSHSGNWILAPPIPGTMVVNIADCLSIWTNKKFKSTIHRVTNLSGKNDTQFPSFLESTIMPQFLCWKTTPRLMTHHASHLSRPERCMQWVREKLAKAYVGYEG